MLLADAMFQELGLSLYVPLGGVAHVVQTYAGRGEVYIFCTRFYGNGNGQLVPPQDAMRFLAQRDILCGECMEALEAILEGLVVLKGKHPPSHSIDAPCTRAVAHGESGQSKH